MAAAADPSSLNEWIVAVGEHRHTFRDTMTREILL